MCTVFTSCTHVYALHVIYIHMRSRIRLTGSHSIYTYQYINTLFSLLLPISGLSPDLQSMEQVRRIMRPTDVPDQGLLCDLLWADPDKETMGWGENDRGVSFTFGPEIVTKFLHKHDMDLICRAHQVSHSPFSL